MKAPGNVGNIWGKVRAQGYSLGVKCLRARGGRSEEGRTRDTYNFEKKDQGGG